MHRERERGEIHLAHKILTTGLHFTVMALLRGIKFLQKKKIRLRGKGGKGKGTHSFNPNNRRWEKL